MKSFKNLLNLKTFFIFTIILCLSLSAEAFPQFLNFITAENDKLMDGDKELRFVSYNIPNLHYIEDQLAFEAMSPWRLPDEFEIRDALNSIRMLGGKVARMYVLSVRKEGESHNIIRHVEGPGQFNEEAFKALDKVMQVANETGIRVIIPFVDNWWWWGGPIEYAAFRDKPKEEFWTDPQLIADFKKTIEFLVNRRNTYTGVLYKDDKALMGWETGNEMECPFSWTAEIAAYIKSLDQNHLVIEGTHNNKLTEEALNDPNIDVLSTHHYSRAPETIQRIKENREFAKGKKPYFIGEFGLVPFEDIKLIVDSTMESGVSGIMIWSLRFHNRDGGFYLHRENTGAGPYRFPGFSTGAMYNEREAIEFLREKAYGVDGKEVPAPEIPIPSVLLDIEDPFSISWQGSTGAEYYNVERRDSSGAWAVVGENIIDAESGYWPPFIDTSASLGAEYYYRVTANNETGASMPSNEIGPVNVEYLKLIDELRDDSKILHKEGEFEFLQFQDIYKAKEDNSRLKGESDSYIIYPVNGEVTSFKVYAFTEYDSPVSISLLAADSSEEYIPVITKIETFPSYKNVYGFFNPVIFTSEEFPPDTKFLKIYFDEEAQLSRVEIKYY